jgi:hypothetical protein
MALATLPMTVGAGLYFAHDAAAHARTRHPRAA